MLPFKSQDRLAIIGAFANQPRYQGSGSSHVNAYQVLTPLDALDAALLCQTTSLMRPGTQLTATMQINP